MIVEIRWKTNNHKQSIARFRSVKHDLPAGVKVLHSYHHLGEPTGVVYVETGIKFGQLKENFGLTLYGKFERAHVAFGGYQRDLAKAFAEGKDIQPLGFRVGYFKGGSYALIVAKRKS